MKQLFNSTLLSWKAINNYYKAKSYLNIKRLIEVIFLNA